MQMGEILLVGLLCFGVESGGRVVIVEIDQQIGTEQKSMGADLVQTMGDSRVGPCRDGECQIGIAARACD